MNLLFVNYGGFENINSAIHIFHLANHLVEQGMDCAVAVRGSLEEVRVLGKPRFQCLTYEMAEAGKFGFRDHGGPSLIHAWTPRECVRRLVQRISRAQRCPYFVHLEDNEDEIAAKHTGLPSERLHSLSAAQLTGLIPEDFSHPIFSRQFLANAAGLTVIIDKLLEFKPHGTPAEILWPGFDPAFANLPDGNAELRYGLGIGEDEFVVVYPGNTHASNIEEIRGLYTSVGLLNSRGHKVRLIRFGTDYCDPLQGNWDFVRPYCVELGFRAKHALVGPTAMADALVQPGKPSRFNDYRLPSKLPDFLVSGRPVVLPRTNLGRFLRDGEECLLLEEGDALDIAGRLELLIRDAGLRRQIGAAGKQFACRELSWGPIAARILCFYKRVLAGPDAPPVAESVRSHTKFPESEWRPLRAPRWAAMDAATLEAAAARYAGSFAAAPLSYATVQDFSDSRDYLQALATETHDLKDCQRPWTLKAILGAVPHGGRLLEIGAGEPIVAELLACLGYDVTVVDPYEGAGNGPQEYEQFRVRYPGVRILRNAFGEDTGDLAPGTFDCIYSISVLEHLPAPELTGVFKGIERLLKPDGQSIHAVDYVLRGAGADWDKEHIAQVMALSGLPAEDFDALKDRMIDDPDTYYLSAESHNLWRGSKPYAEFPMRSVVGLQIRTGRPLVGAPLEAPAASAAHVAPEASPAFQEASPLKEVYERTRLAALLDGLWTASTVAAGPHSLRLVGWTIHPCDQPGQFFLTMNGLPMQLEKYSVHTGLAERLNVTHCYSFAGEIAFDRLPAGPVEFHGSFGSPDSQRVAGSFYWPTERMVLPEPARRARVHGTEEESSFDLIGCTIAEKMRRLLDLRFNKTLEEFGRVLDWGCGCGRVARFLFPSFSQPCGIDIDGDNIDWCRKNLPGEFHAISLTPPTFLPDRYFELIYGISIFTHLSAYDQVKWLQELARLAAPGAHVLVTVHGYTSWLLNDPGVEKYLKWERKGILDLGENADLQGAVPDPSRYRSMFHTPAYIRRVWQNWFDVVDILPGWAASNQDLVILRARGGRNVPVG